jgi:hypothetical protein
MPRRKSMVCAKKQVSNALFCCLSTLGEVGCKWGGASSENHGACTGLTIASTSRGVSRAALT